MPHKKEQLNNLYLSRQQRVIEAADVYVYSNRPSFGAKLLQMSNKKNDVRNSTQQQKAKQWILHKCFWGVSRPQIYIRGYVKGTG